MSVPNQLSYANTRSTSVVKSYFSKPMMFIIAALTILGTVLQFMVNNETVSANSSSQNNIISLLLSAVVAVSLFMIFFMSKKPSANPSLFFGILYVLSLIELILFALLSLITMLLGLMLVINSNTILTYAFDHPDQLSGIDLSALNKEELSEQITMAKIPMLIALLVMFIVLVVIGVFINSQTAFLKACRRSCKGNALFHDGASSYGTLSVVVGFISLIFVVVAFMVSYTGGSTLEDFGVESPSDVGFSTLSLVYYIVLAATIFIRGTFAKGWIKFSRENEAYVEQGNVSTITRSADSNPIATFKSTQRKSNDAIHQNQSYLYGETQEKDPNKKSEYIPEELQNDYPSQPYNQPMGSDPFMGDPFAQPVPPQNPYAHDPFAADPFASDPFAQTGNPYGNPNPNDQNYNNGMM